MRSIRGYMDQTEVNDWGWSI